jgi:hypothetical protein
MYLCTRQGAISGKEPALMPAAISFELLTNKIIETT